MIMDRRRIVLPENIGFLLRMAQLHSFREFDLVFADTGLTPAMLTVLIVMRDNPGIRQRDLAAALMMRQPNLTSLIGALWEAKLVSRRIDKRDRRALDLQLTSLGKKQVEEMRARLRALDAAILKSLRPQQRRALRRYLGSLLDHPLHIEVPWPCRPG